jgi:hypothetical protein
VNVSNFEGTFGQLHHRREPAAIDWQDVVRMNRDTFRSVSATPAATSRRTASAPTRPTTSPPSRIRMAPPPVQFGGCQPGTPNCLPSAPDHPQWHLDVPGGAGWPRC